MTNDREAERSSAVDDYYYRRALGGRDLLPAIGAGVAVGFAGFYLARLLLQRTRLAPEDGIAVVGERGTQVRRMVTTRGGRRARSAAGAK